MKLALGLHGAARHTPGSDVHPGDLYRLADLRIGENVWFGQK